MKREELKDLYSTFITANPEIMNISEDKEVVIVYGYVGSGRSTLVNFLMGKQLIVNKHKRLELKDDLDKNAAEIGHSLDTQTHLPKMFEIEGIKFVDMPGLADTRDQKYELLNASVLKTILENSKGVIILIVVEWSNLLSCRGEVFKKLIDSSKDLFGEWIDVSSSLVITKSDSEDTLEQLIEEVNYVSKSEEHLQPWLRNNQISVFSKPYKDKLDLDDKFQILEKIKKTKPTKIKNIKIENILKWKDYTQLNNILQEEFDEILNSTTQKISPGSNKEILSNIKEFYKYKFENEIKENLIKSNIIKYIRPIENKKQDQQTKWENKIDDIKKSHIAEVKKDLETEQKKEEEARIKKQTEQKRQEEERMKKEIDKRVRIELIQKDLNDYIDFRYYVKSVYNNPGLRTANVFSFGIYFKILDDKLAYAENKIRYLEAEKAKINNE